MISTNMVHTVSSVDMRQHARCLLKIALSRGDLVSNIDPLQLSFANVCKLEFNYSVTIFSI